MKAVLVLAVMLFSGPAVADAAKDREAAQPVAAKAPARPRVATQKLMPPPWERTPGGAKAVKPAPIASGSPR